MSKHRPQLEDETKEMYMHRTTMETEWKHDKKRIKTRWEKGRNDKRKTHVYVRVVYGWIVKKAPELFRQDSWREQL